MLLYEKLKCLFLSKDATYNPISIQRKALNEYEECSMPRGYVIILTVELRTK